MRICLEGVALRCSFVNQCRKLQKKLRYDLPVAVSLNYFGINCPEAEKVKIKEENDQKTRYNIKDII